MSSDINPTAGTSEAPFKPLTRQQIAACRAGYS